MHCKVGHLSAQNNIDIYLLMTATWTLIQKRPLFSLSFLLFTLLHATAAHALNGSAALIAWSSQLCWAIIIRTSHALHTNAFHSFDHVQRIINNNNSNKTTTMATFEKISTERAIHPSISHLRLLVFLGPTFVPLQQSHKRPSQRTSKCRRTWDLVVAHSHSLSPSHSP